MTGISRSARIHPTAIVERSVKVGAGTAIWDCAHLRHGARVGAHCIVGEKAYLAPGVIVGDRCKVGPFVNLCAGVVLETGVMVAIGVVFTNELFPRATTPDLRRLRPSEPTARTLATRVEAGATIGANATIRGGIVIGRWAMVGMGAVVTRSVPAFHLVLGHPARSVGVVCRCGERIANFAPDERRAGSRALDLSCVACGRRYRLAPDDGVRERSSR